MEQTRGRLPIGQADSLIPSIGVFLAIPVSVWEGLHQEIDSQDEPFRYSEHLPTNRYNKTGKEFADGDQTGKTTGGGAVAEASHWTLQGDQIERKFAFQNSSMP